MKMLLLLRGLPASGKSTFIEKNHLQDYTLSSDVIRQLFGSNELNIKGKYGINQNVSGAAWNKLYEIMEERFKIGAFTVLDSTNIKTADMSKAYKLAKAYRYRVFCVDFTDVPLDECIKRDAMRPEVKQVGKYVLNKMYESLKGSVVPGGITVIKPEDWLKETKYRTQDISEYKKVHHIGDIHGCYTAIQNYLNGDLKDDEFYIFIGDYIDRGIENVEMVNFISSIANKENVVLLEGNHECMLNSYIKDEESRSKEFENETRVQFDAFGSDIIKKQCKEIIKKLRQCFIYKWNDKIVLCTHGGLSRMPSNLSLINTEQLIKGVGVYRDMLEVNNSFAEQNWNKEIYQVHGHRNVEQVKIEVNNRCFNICGHIEYGGNLRCLTLDETGFKGVLTPNPKYKITKDTKFQTVGDMLDVLESHENIQISKQANTNINAYNFTRDAFTGGLWDETTTKARGLFINSNTKEIVARGYDKFFNLNERPETNLDVIPNRLSYPVTAYKKENGFLGLLGFDKEQDKVVFCSKSTIDGPYAKYFKDILLSVVSEEKLYNYLKPHNVTLLFEVVDVVNDPHIITYPKNKVILLDIVENTINFKPYPYDIVKQTAEILNLDVKEESKVLQNKEELIEFFETILKEDFKWNGKYIEGFVFSDINHFMFKFKTEYYKYWKSMRGAVEKMRSGKSLKGTNDFLTWVGKDKARYTKDIITLRSEYLKEVRNK